MLCAGSRELTRHATGYRIGSGSPEVAPLTSASTAPAEVSDAFTDAIQRHERASLG
jgi:hypothetical protein